MIVYKIFYIFDLFYFKTERSENCLNPDVTALGA